MAGIIMNQDIEYHRNLWANIAKENGWYTEPFYVQLFIDPVRNEIYDSVSFGGMTQDIFHYEEEWQEA
jgi:hypothetical protein